MSYATRIAALLRQRMLIAMLVIFVLHACSASAKSVWIQVTPESLSRIVHPTELTCNIVGGNYVFTVWSGVSATDSDASAALITKDSGGILSQARLEPHSKCGGTVWYFSVSGRIIESSQLRIDRDPFVYIFELGPLLSVSFVPFSGEPKWCCEPPDPDACGSAEDEVVLDQRSLVLGTPRKAAR
jgi:hypothetical protein